MDGGGPGDKPLTPGEIPRLSLNQFGPFHRHTNESANVLR